MVVRNCCFFVIFCVTVQNLTVIALQILEISRFLANVNSRSRSLYAIARPSVVCL